MTAHLGFTVVDYSTGSLVGASPGDNLLVIVPKRPTSMTPLVEARGSSVRLREERLYFKTTRNTKGDVIIADLPPDTYSASFYATGYVPARMQVTSPRLDPLPIRLHRDASFRFAAEDTLILGEVVNASGEPHTGFDVTFVDSSEPIANHQVPLNAKGQFVIFVPEKKTSGSVTLRVQHAGGIVTISIPTVVLKRPNIACQVPNSSVITVP